MRIIMTKLVGHRTLKIMTVVGTRPELIRLSSTIKVLDKYLNHILIHTGQNYDYELNGIFFDDLGIRAPDFFLECAGGTPGSAIAQIISKTDEIFGLHEPDCILILGDTNSALCAIPAKRRKIPIFHMEAGNRCFDMRVPEEINRKIVDHIADINLPYSDIAREHLLREGLDPITIIKTGSPLPEVLLEHKQKIKSSNILSHLGLTSGDYFVVSSHREENVDSPLKMNKFVDLLNSLSEEYKLPVIFSVHPRTRKRIEEAGLEFDSRVRLIKPLAFSDYIKLQLCSKAVLSDSGTITEEANILNFCALNLRETHERPEGMEAGAVMLTGLNIARVFKALEVLEGQNKTNPRLIELVPDYTDTNISSKILRIILSYTDFVNSKIWKKF
jgi:UDP-N-acetylglucosamine 2-epimerase